MIGKAVGLSRRRKPFETGGDAGQGVGSGFRWIALAFSRTQGNIREEQVDEGREQLKIMTYNICDGGQDGFDHRRLDLILDVISVQAPDVLAVQEAKYFELNGHRTLHRVENALHMRAILATPATGQNVALFLPQAARLLETHLDTVHFHHALVRVSLAAADGRSLTVIATHLCPHGGENRLREAQFLTNYARENELVLLLGDLNALSPHESHVESIERLPSHYRARHLLAGDGFRIDTRAVAFLEAAGFVDLYRHLHPGERQCTAPTRGPGGHEFADMRVDYIFGTAPVAEITTGCSVVKTDETDRASDHYPVVAEIGLDI
jgi:exodeoxyribonuclease-3